MREDLKTSGSFMTVGLELVVSIVFGYLGGQWLDGTFGTAPALTIAGCVCGLLAGARFVYRAAQRMKRQTERDGFKASATGRSARYAMDQKDHERP